LPAVFQNSRKPASRARTTTKMLAAFKSEVKPLLSAIDTLREVFDVANM
jgi:hypothetical protein